MHSFNPNRGKTMKIFRSALGTAALMLLLNAPMAQAATITVNTTLDNPVGTADSCSLRQAIQAANTDLADGNCTAGSGDDVIEFVDPTGTYVLTLSPSAGVENNDNLDGDLDICSNITINGGGIGITVISAEFESVGDRVLDILNDTSSCLPNPGGDSDILPNVIVNGVTIQNGTALVPVNGVIGGGGIQNAGILTLASSELTNNSASNESNQQFFSNDVMGGGLYNRTTTVIEASLIHNNNVTLDAAALSRGSGGGVSSNGDTNATGSCGMSVTTTQINENSVNRGTGGGLSNEQCSTLVLQSAVFDNQALANGDDASPFYGSGGGIFNNITETTGLFLNVVDSTLSGNFATTSGGGLTDLRGPETQTQFNSSTVAFNSANTDSGFAGGLYIPRQTTGGTFDFQNTIVSNNTAFDSPDCTQGISDDPAQIFNSIGYNLVMDTTNCVIGGAQTGDLPAGTDPLLDVLADNGGLTPTHALTFGSPAIDAGRPEGEGGCTDDVDGGLSLEFDQRNDPFLRVVAGIQGGTPRCDMGAYEYAPTTIEGVKSVSDSVVSIGDEFTYTITVTNTGLNDATGVVMVDDLPEEVDFVAFGNISQGSCENADDVITCNFDTLAPEESATVEIIVVAVSAGEIVNQATITTDETDPDDPETTNTVPTTINNTGVLQGSGLLPCSLQRGAVPAHTPWVLMGLLGSAFAAMVWQRSRTQA